MVAVTPVTHEIFIQEILKKRSEASEDSRMHHESISRLASKIEDSLFKLFKDTGTKYKNKYRSIIFNLKVTSFLKSVLVSLNNYIVKKAWSAIKHLWELRNGDVTRSGTDMATEAIESFCYFRDDPISSP